MQELFLAARHQQFLSFGISATHTRMVERIIHEILRVRLSLDEMGGDSRLMGDHVRVAIAISERMLSRKYVHIKIKLIL